MDLSTNSSKRPADDNLFEETSQKRVKTEFVYDKSITMSFALYECIVSNGDKKCFPKLLNIDARQGLLKKSIRLQALVDEWIRRLRSIPLVYSDIRALLKVLYAEKYGTLAWPSKTLRSDAMSATEYAWNVPYVGNGVNRLLDRIEQGETILRVIQSSGTGKSRTVHELSKKIFTIPMCLREAYPEDTGFPYGDAPLLAAFKRMFQARYDNEFIIKSMCVGFFTCIFQHILAQIRAPLCKMAPAEWRRLLEEERGDTVTFREHIYNCARNDLDPVSSFKSADESYLKSNILVMRDTLSELLQYVSNEGTRAKIIVYIDECHFLGSQRNLIEGDPRSALDFICFAMEECRTEGLSGILISTNSASSQLLATTKSGGIQQSPPFVHFAFDAWNGQSIIKEGTSSLKDVCSLEFLARFGRPLWWTRLADEKTGQEMLDDLILFAQQKLLLAVETPDNISEDPTRMYAVLASRLALQLHPLYAGADQFVATHMAIAYHAPADDEYLFAGYSSEPVIAEAAAWIWWGLERNLKLNVASMVCWITNKNLVAEKNRGEVIARFILTRTQDLATRGIRLGENKEMDQSTRIWDPKAPYNEAVPLWTFFKTLFPDYAKKLGSAKPRNKKDGETMEDACKDKYVRFTHFARAGDSSVVSTAAAWKALARANAWQCYDRQKYINIIVPVHVMTNGPETKLGRNSVTFILVQVNSPTHTQADHFSAETLGIFDDVPEPLAEDIPYFVIVFNLKTTSKSDHKKLPYERPAVRRPLHTNDPQPNGYTCYWVEVQGCSSRALNEEIAQGTNLLNILHRKSTKLDEYEESYLRLKSVFSAHPTSFSWAQDSDVLGPISKEEEEEGADNFVYAVEIA